jgi:hypothetical protein
MNKDTVKKSILTNFIYAVTFVLIVFYSEQSYAGPPFFTDDPQPVDLFHWEFYMSSAMDIFNKDISMTCPHAEINYGVIQNVQLHLLAPLGYVKNEGGKAYGYMDTEIGIKYRFINEDNGLMIGVFPLIEIPTGNEKLQLGNGRTKYYLPLWVQKTSGNFTTYFGAGYWINPGNGNKNYSFIGWEGQYDFSSTLTLGGEIYHQTPDVVGGNPVTGFNLGGYININQLNHILFSLGHSFTENEFTAYLGFQMTM